MKKKIAGNNRITSAPTRPQDIGGLLASLREVIQTALFNEAVHRTGLSECCLHDVGEFGFGLHGCIPCIFAFIMVQ